MIVSASKSVTPFIMPEAVQYVDIVYQPSAVSVDCNNVQANPLKLQAVYRNGKDAEPYEVYWRMQVQQGGKQLGSADSPGASSAWEYCLPTDRWGSADSIVVEAYQDASYRVLLARETVGILRQNSTPFPVEGEWKPLPFKYKNGEYFLDSASGFIFMWMNPVPGNSELHPLEDIKQHPNETCWKKHQEYPLLATQVFLAQYAKLGSAVFNGDYMFSQHGKDAGGNDTTDYRSPSFTPNFQVDWLKGKVTGKDMDMQGGSVGGFELTGFNLRNKNGRDCWVSIRTNDGDNTRISSLGNCLPSVLGYSVAGYYESSGTSTNKALVLRAFGSKKHAGISGKFENHCIDAIGGVNWHMDGKDHWCMPGVLYAAHFGGGGELYEDWGDGVRIKVENAGHPSIGTYSITHNIGHMSYFVAITPMRNWTFATLQHKDVNSFGFTIADANRGLIDSEFDLVIFGRPFEDKKK